MILIFYISLTVNSNTLLNKESHDLLAEDGPSLGPRAIGELVSLQSNVTDSHDKTALAYEDSEEGDSPETSNKRPPPNGQTATNTKTEKEKTPAPSDKNPPPNGQTATNTKTEKEKTPAPSDKNPPSTTGQTATNTKTDEAKTPATSTKQPPSTTGKTATNADTDEEEDSADSDEQITENDQPSISANGQVTVEHYDKLMNKYVKQKVANDGLTKKIRIEQRKIGKPPGVNNQANQPTVPPNGVQPMMQPMMQPPMMGPTISVGGNTVSQPPFPPDGNSRSVTNGDKEKTLKDNIDFDKFEKSKKIFNDEKMKQDLIGEPSEEAIRKKLTENLQPGDNYIDLDGVLKKHEEDQASYFELLLKLARTAYTNLAFRFTPQQQYGNSDKMRSSFPQVITRQIHLPQEALLHCSGMSDMKDETSGLGHCPFTYEDQNEKDIDGNPIRKKITDREFVRAGCTASRVHGKDSLTKFVKLKPGSYNFVYKTSFDDAQKIPKIEDPFRTEGSDGFYLPLKVDLEDTVVSNDNPYPDNRKTSKYQQQCCLATQDSFANYHRKDVIREAGYWSWQPGGWYKRKGPKMYNSETGQKNEPKMLDYVYRAPRWKFVWPQNQKTRLLKSNARKTGQNEMELEDDKPPEETDGYQVIQCATWKQIQDTYGQIPTTLDKDIQGYERRERDFPYITLLQPPLSYYATTCKIVNESHFKRCDNYQFLGNRDPRHPESGKWLWMQPSWQIPLSKMRLVLQWKCRYQDKEKTMNGFTVPLCQRVDQTNAQAEEAAEGNIPRPDMRDNLEQIAADQELQSRDPLPIVLVSGTFHFRAFSFEPGEAVNSGKEVRNPQYKLFTTFVLNHSHEEWYIACLPPTYNTFTGSENRPRERPSSQCLLDMPQDGQYFNGDFSTWNDIAMVKGLDTHIPLEMIQTDFEMPKGPKFERNTKKLFVKDLNALEDEGETKEKISKEEEENDLEGEGATKEKKSREEEEMGTSFMRDLQYKARKYLYDPLTQFQEISEASHTDSPPDRLRRSVDKVALVMCVADCTHTGGCLSSVLPWYDSVQLPIIVHEGDQFLVTKYGYSSVPYSKSKWIALADSTLVNGALPIYNFIRKNGSDMYNLRAETVIVQAAPSFKLCCITEENGCRMPSAEELFKELGMHNSEKMASEAHLLINTINQFEHERKKYEKQFMKHPYLEGLDPTEANRLMVQYKDSKKGLMALQNLRQQNLTKIQKFMNGQIRGLSIGRGMENPNAFRINQELKAEEHAEFLSEFNNKFADQGVILAFERMKMIHNFLSQYNSDGLIAPAIAEERMEHMLNGNIPMKKESNLPISQRIQKFADIISTPIKKEKERMKIKESPYLQYIHKVLGDDQFKPTSSHYSEKFVCIYFMLQAFSKQPFTTQLSDNAWQFLQNQIIPLLRDYRYCRKKPYRGICSGKDESDAKKAFKERMLSFNDSTQNTMIGNKDLNVEAMKSCHKNSLMVHLHDQFRKRAVGMDNWTGLQTEEETFGDQWPLLQRLINIASDPRSDRVTQLEAKRKIHALIQDDEKLRNIMSHAVKNAATSKAEQDVFKSLYVGDKIKGKLKVIGKNINNGFGLNIDDHFDDDVKEHEKEFEKRKEEEAKEKEKEEEKELDDDIAEVKRKQALNIPVPEEDTKKVEDAEKKLDETKEKEKTPKEQVEDKIEDAKAHGEDVPQESKDEKETLEEKENDTPKEEEDRKKIGEAISDTMEKEKTGDEEEDTITKIIAQKKEEDKIDQEAVKDEDANQPTDEPEDIETPSSESQIGDTRANDPGAIPDPKDALDPGENAEDKPVEIDEEGGKDPDGNQTEEEKKEEEKTDEELIAEGAKDDGGDKGKEEHDEMNKEKEEGHDEMNKEKEEGHDEENKEKEEGHDEEQKDKDEDAETGNGEEEKALAASEAAGDLQNDIENGKGGNEVLDEDSEHGSNEIDEMAKKMDDEGEDDTKEPETPNYGKFLLDARRKKKNKMQQRKSNIPEEGKVLELNEFRDPREVRVANVNDGRSEEDIKSDEGA